MKNVKAINAYFKYATKQNIDDLRNNIVLSDREAKIFDMYYIRKQNVNFIADSLFVCGMVVNKELHTIRVKISKYLKL